MLLPLKLHHSAVRLLPLCMCMCVYVHVCACARVRVHVCVRVRVRMHVRVREVHKSTINRSQRVHMYRARNQSTPAAHRHAACVAVELVARPPAAPLRGVQRTHWW